MAVSDNWVSLGGVSVISERHEMNETFEFNEIAFDRLSFFFLFYKIKKASDMFAIGGVTLSEKSYNV